jgi:hypothetical protein
MPKHLPNFGHRSTDAQQRRREAVPQEMGTTAWRLVDASAVQRARNHRAHDAGSSERMMRGARAQEDSSTGAAWTCLAQIDRERLADIGRQWQSISNCPFARHRNLRGAPVDVGQLQHHDLEGT